MRQFGRYQCECGELEGFEETGRPGMKGLGFYEASAQIIPISLLAASVLNRDRGLPRLWPFLSRSFRLEAYGTLIFVVVAEWRALNALRTENPALLDPWLVGICVFSLGLGLCGPALGNPFAPTTSVKELHRSLDKAKRLRDEGRVEESDELLREIESRLR